MNPFLLSLSIYLALTCFAQAENDHWISLFNGKDLSAWHTNRAEGSFSVKDGLLMAQRVDMRSHLFYMGDDQNPVAFKNLELVVVAKGDAQSNSGIFIHTDYALRDEKGRRLQRISKPKTQGKPPRTPSKAKRRLHSTPSPRPR